MSFVTLKHVLDRAKDEKTAIPQFNINSYIWAESILEVAQEVKSEIIIGVTDKNVKRLGGYSFIKKMTELMMLEWKINVPVVLHLDHGQSVVNCKKAIDVGFSSVMFDGSSLSFEENVTKTKEVVEYAHKYGVSVEGEIGGIGGTEDNITSEINYADPKECIEFVKKTNVDALAAALGSVHGPYTGEPKLKFEVMEIINKKIKKPLVLHGASGLPDNDIKKIIDFGHAKINYNTELNLSIANATRDLLNKNKDLYDPKIIISVGKLALKESISEKINLLKNN